MRAQRRQRLLIFPMILIAVLFVITGLTVFQKFRAEFTTAELANQQKMTRIIHQSLNLYFEKIQFITENTVLQNAFRFEQNRDEDALRFSDVQSRKIDLARLGINDYLIDVSKALKIKDHELPAQLKNWQLFKGLPELDGRGNLIAESRRTIARNILKTFRDIHYVFEMDEGGDLVFLEPFEIQKNITSFNYRYRDYLRLVKTYRATAISEGYISHDQNRTQIITVASPIFDKSGKVVKVFAASVSAATLRESVFKTLAESMSIQDGTVFYLVDRHGHVVASSSGHDIYFPRDSADNDESDRGNLRYTGFFKNINWSPDVLEKGNVWERVTKSWDMSSLKKDFFGEYQNLSGVPVFGSFYPIGIGRSDTNNWGILIETPASVLSSAEYYLQGVFIAVGLVLVLILAILFRALVKVFSRLESELDFKEQELARVSAQVAHDIRSPLTALEMAFSDLSEMSEEKRVLVRSAASRIKDIANNLLRRENKPNKDEESFSLTLGPAPRDIEPVTTHMLSCLIDELCSEKRLQYKASPGVEINKPADFYEPYFADVQCMELKRVLSNLIDNSVEALPGQGRVELSVTARQNVIEIIVRDNGKGIPPSVLPELAKRGATFGKDGGTGLGLYSAKMAVERWGGSLRIESELGRGTSVIITLPRASTPQWFVPQLEIPDHATVVIVDDDPSVHFSWMRRFESQMKIGQDIDLVRFTTGEAFRDWVRSQGRQSSDMIYLIDQNLNHDSPVGLDLIDQLGIASRSFLVTNQHDEPAIHKRCAKLGVRLIPKGMVPWIPIAGPSRLNQINHVFTHLSRKQ